LYKISNKLKNYFEQMADEFGITIKTFINVLQDYIGDNILSDSDSDIDSDS